MNKLAKAGALLGLIAFSAIAVAQPVLAGVPEPLFGQKTNVWCWAASGEMAMQYFNHTVQQCAEATLQFGQPAGVDCCNSPTPGACISGGQVYINHYGFTYQQLGGNAALTHNQIVEQIVTRNEPWISNPYCADSSKCGSWGHVVTGIGYLWPLRQVFPNLFFVWANDPWPVNTGSSYFQFYRDYKKGCWWGLGSCDGYAEGWDIYDIVSPKVTIHKAFQVAEIARQPWPPEEARLLMEGDTDPTKVAQAALRLMTIAITKESAATLGLESPAAAANARLQPAVEQFDISFARLRSWKVSAEGEPASRAQLWSGKEDAFPQALGLLSSKGDGKPDLAAVVVRLPSRDEEYRLQLLDLTPDGFGEVRADVKL